MPSTHSGMDGEELLVWPWQWGRGGLERESGRQSAAKGGATGLTECAKTIEVPGHFFHFLFVAQEISRKYPEVHIQCLRESRSFPHPGNNPGNTQVENVAPSRAYGFFLHWSGNPWKLAAGGNFSYNLVYLRYGSDDPCKLAAGGEFSYSFVLRE